MINQKKEIAKKACIDAMTNYGFEFSIDGEQISGTRNGITKSYVLKSLVMEFGEKSEFYDRVYAYVLIDLISNNVVETKDLLPYLLTVDEVLNLDDEVYVEKLSDGRYITYKDELILRGGYLTKKQSEIDTNFKEISFANLGKKTAKNVRIKKFDAFDFVEIINLNYHLDPRNALLSDEVIELLTKNIKGNIGLITTSKDHLFAFEFGDNHPEIVFDVINSKMCEHCSEFILWDYQDYQLYHLLTMQPTLIRKDKR